MYIEGSAAGYRIAANENKILEEKLSVKEFLVNKTG